MSRLRILTGGVLALVLLGGPAVTVASTAASAKPSATVVIVVPASVAPGMQIGVHGLNFPPRQAASVAICGDGGLEGAQGCDLASQATLLTDNAGNFYITLRVARPPVACPCVVEVDTASSVSRARLTIVGAPWQPLKTPAVALAPDLHIEHARLVGSGSWLAWLGFPAHRTLTFTVVNRGSAAAISPPLLLDIHAWLAGESTVSSPDLGTIGPGKSRGYRIPVDLGPVATGHFSLQGQLSLPADSISFRASTFSAPWLLIIGLLLAAQGGLIFLRNRLRNRLDRRPTVGATDPVTPVEAVLDLRPPEPTPALLDLREPEPITDQPVSGSDEGWTITTRLVFFVPERSLTCAIERLACPSVDLERTWTRIWDGFATAPWDALYDEIRWGPPDHQYDATLKIEDRALTIELRLESIGESQRLSDTHRIELMQATGRFVLDDEEFVVDGPTLLERISNQSPAAPSYSYGMTRSGEGFYLVCGADEAAGGFLVRDGQVAPLVQGRRYVSERSGPFASAIRLELRDDLWRTMICDGHTLNRMGSRQGADGLVWACLAEWRIGEHVAYGEDVEGVSLADWRSRRRADAYVEL